jgi:hypothetical protein
LLGASGDHQNRLGFLLDFVRFLMRCFFFCRFRIAYPALPNIHLHYARMPVHILQDSWRWFQYLEMAGWRSTIIFSPATASDLRGDQCESGDNELPGTERVPLTSATRSCRYPLLVLPPAPMQAVCVVPLSVSHCLECHATLYTLSPSESLWFSQIMSHRSGVGSW